MNSSDGTGGNSVWMESRRHCAEDSVTIEASVDAVWDLLSDYEGWSCWNPLYVETSGTMRVGETIGFAVALEGMKPQKGHATVMTVRPNELLEYRTRAFGGLVRATRYIDIRAAGPGQCTVVNGEHMGGPLGPLLFRIVGGKVRRGMQGMNAELKKLAEARG